MFIALLVMQLTNRGKVAVAIFAGFLSLGFKFAGLDQWHVILATVVGATIGVVIERWNSKE
jgi:chromate transport protein ChrA